MRRRRITAPKDEALAETRELARLYVPEALEWLVDLARSATSEPVRITAIKEILDRAHGRPAPSLGESAGGLRYVLVSDGYPD
jgi:hypothetical protein